VVFEKEYIMRCSSDEELLETDVPWDDAIVVWAGKLRKLWDSLNELRSSVCVWKTTGKNCFEACAIAYKNWAVYSVFSSGMTSHSKIAQFNWQWLASLTGALCSVARTGWWQELSNQGSLCALTDIYVVYIYIYIYIYIYRVSQEECARLREGVPYFKVYRYNPKHLCPKLNGYGNNGQRSLKLWQLLTHLLITKYILKLAGICGFCNVNICT